MNAIGFRLQPADIACWELIGELGCLDTLTIHDRIYSTLSLRGCQRRLKLAADHGYLRRAALTVSFRSDGNGRDRGGAVPVLHMVTVKAADIVERETAVRPPRVLRSDPAAATFLHRWHTVLHRLAFDDALDAAGLPAALWIMEQDPWPGAAEKLPPNQRRMLYHHFNGNGQLATCQPDAACLVTLPPHEGAPATPVVCFWEIDEGSEGLRQIKNKLPGYAALLHNRGWARYFPVPGKCPVRILWVCQTAERVDSLRKAIADHSVASICRFAVAKDVTAKAVLSSPIWCTVNGERRSFLM